MYSFTRNTKYVNKSVYCESEKETLGKFSQNRETSSKIVITTMKQTRTVQKYLTQPPSRTNLSVANWSFGGQNKSEVPQCTKHPRHPRCSSRKSMATNSKQGATLKGSNHLLTDKCGHKSVFQTRGRCSLKGETHSQYLQWNLQRHLPSLSEQPLLEIPSLADNKMQWV